MNAIVSNLLTNYADSGPSEAPVVLMLHGWGSSIGAFQDLADRLQPKTRVVRLDFPGFGGTQMPPASWRIEDYALFTRAFLDKLGVEQPWAIIAHSFGGRVTLKAAGEGIIMPHRIILMGSAGVRHAQSVRNQAFKIVAKTGKAVTALPGLGVLRSKLRQRLYQAAGSTDYLNAGPLRQIFLNTIDEDLQASAAHIAAPTTLIWGENDTEAPVADGRLLKETIPHAQLRIIPGAGHFVFHDAPEDVARLIGKALER